MSDSRQDEAFPNSDILR